MPKNNILGIVWATLTEFFAVRSSPGIGCEYKTPMSGDGVTLRWCVLTGGGGWGRGIVGNVGYIIAVMSPTVLELH